jgi:hypothetical protein
VLYMPLDPTVNIPLKGFLVYSFQLVASLNSYSVWADVVTTPYSKRAFHSPLSGLMSEMGILQQFTVTPVESDPIQHLRYAFPHG